MVFDGIRIYVFMLHFTLSTYVFMYLCIYVFMFLCFYLIFNTRSYFDPDEKSRPFVQLKLTQNNNQNKQINI